MGSTVRFYICVFSISIIYSKSLIEYSSIQEETKAIVVTVHNREKRISVSLNDIIEVYDPVRLKINYIHESYTIEFNSMEHASRFGFDSLSNWVRYNDFLKLESFKDTNDVDTIVIRIKYHVESNNEIQFKNDLYISDLEELKNYFLIYCSQLFESFTLNKSELFQFKVRENVRSIKFDGILTKTLGLEKQYYYRVKPDAVEFKGFRIPKIIDHHQQMFIYSNIIEPLIVGDVKVSLLKSIWLEKYENDEVVQIIVKNPMYLPVALSYINNIEINIRDDSGKLIKFANDSKTHLTLHFRKRNV